MRLNSIRFAEKCNTGRAVVTKPELGIKRVFATRDPLLLRAQYSSGHGAARNKLYGPIKSCADVQQQQADYDFCNFPVVTIQKRIWRWTRSLCCASIFHKSWSFAKRLWNLMVTASRSRRAGIPQ